MKEFFQSILPRIQNKSRTLNQTELFVEKPWVLVDESTQELLEYEFFRDGRLLVSRGGNAAWGKWELAPSSQRLILEYGEKLLLLHTTFMDDAVMLVQKSGSFESTLAFVNQKKIPDLLYRAYLEKLAEVEELEKARIQVEEKRKQESIIHSKEEKEIKLEKLEEAFEVSYLNTYDEEGEIISGFVWTGTNPNKYYKYENKKKVDHIWHTVQVADHDGNNVLFMSPAEGDVVVSSELIEFGSERSFPTNLKEFIAQTWRGNEIITFDKNHKVIKTAMGSSKISPLEIFIYLIIVSVLFIFALSLVAR